MAVQEIEREIQVLEVFRQILNAPALGPEQNFFEAGGSSLLAARLATRLRATSILDVPASAIFAAPTARALTRYAQPAASSPRPHPDHSTDTPQSQTPAQNRAAGQPVAHGNDHTAIDRGARQRAAYARLRPASAPDVEEVR